MIRNRIGTFGAWLAAIVVLALALRVFYALRYAPDLSWGDGQTYHWLANLLADGHGFIGAHQYMLLGKTQPTAEHPPLYPLLLAGFSKLGLTTWTAHRLVSCALGGAMVVAIGFLGRRVGGEPAGLLAAAIAAVSPLLIVPQGMVGSEALYALLVALTLLAAYRLLDEPSARRAGVLGAAIGLSALTRGEALLLLPLLALPVALKAGGRRWRNLALACVTALVVIAPWTVRSSAVFDRPVYANTSGGLIGGSNCAITYHELVGLWTPACYPSPLPDTDEASQSALLRRRGLTYAGDHLSRVPTVVLIRVLRVWGLYRPDQTATFERAVHGRHLRIQRLGVRVHYVLLALTIVGLIALRRRGAPLAVLLAPVVLATVTAAVGHGSTQYRIAAEVSMAILAAVGLVALRELLAPRLRFGPPR